jgi:hypothetical protein
MLGIAWFERYLHIPVMAQASATQLRVSAIILAVIVGCYAVWIVASELAWPQLPYFPSTADEWRTVRAAHNQASLAARLGLARTDLWTDYAMTDFGLSAGGMPSTDDASKDIQLVTERALALGPHDARAWLMLAAANARLDWINRSDTGPLKMSYFTGPNETALMPLRLSIATQSQAITDPDFQILVAGDLRTILLVRPDLKPTILAAYHDASIDGKHFIEASVNQIDPNFSAQFGPPASPSPPLPAPSNIQPPAPPTATSQPTVSPPSSSQAPNPQPATTQKPNLPVPN